MSLVGGGRRKINSDRLRGHEKGLWLKARSNTGGRTFFQRTLARFYVLSLADKKKMDFFLVLFGFLRCWVFSRSGREIGARSRPPQESCCKRQWRNGQEMRAFLMYIWKYECEIRAYLWNGTRSDMSRFYFLIRHIAFYLYYNINTRMIFLHNLIFMRNGIINEFIILKNIKWSSSW